jgi:hypothetical protein
MLAASYLYLTSPFSMHFYVVLVKNLGLVSASAVAAANSI